MTTFKDDYDLLASRGHARALVKLLRARKWDARVEESGPPGKREYRVVIVGDEMVAYFEKGNAVETFEPRWRGAKR